MKAEGSQPLPLTEWELFLQMSPLPEPDLLMRRFTQMQQHKQLKNTTAELPSNHQVTGKVHLLALGLERLLRDVPRSFHEAVAAHFLPTASKCREAGPKMQREGLCAPPAPARAGSSTGQFTSGQKSLGKCSSVEICCSSVSNYPTEQTMCHRKMHERQRRSSAEVIKPREQTFHHCGTSQLHKYPAQEMGLFTTMFSAAKDLGMGEGSGKNIQKLSLMRCHQL